MTEWNSHGTTLEFRIQAGHSELGFSRSSSVPPEELRGILQQPIISFHIPSWSLYVITQQYFVRRQISETVDTKISSMRAMKAYEEPSHSYTHS